MTTEDFRRSWEQYMRVTNHPEYDGIADSLRKCAGVEKVSWLYRDRYTIHFEPGTDDPSMSAVLSLAEQGGFEACEREHYHREQNRVDIEYRSESVEIPLD